MPKRPRDVNQLAKAIVDIAIGEADDRVSPARRIQMPKGRAGGLKGGPARASALPPGTRAGIAKKAAMSRWKRPTKLR